MFRRRRAEQPAEEGRPAEEQPAEEAHPAEQGQPVEQAVGHPEPAEERPRLSERLGRTRSAMSGPFGRLRGRGRIDDESLAELEDALLLADVGLAATTRILDDLREAVRQRKVSGDPEQLISFLRQEIADDLAGEDRSLSRGTTQPTVWLFVGVNGVGKTTTIGKVARQLTDDGRSVVLAAGDTFRAAAGEQLETWAERSRATLIRGAEGADPSSVVFDAIEHAKARHADFVLADTAGRLHTKVNLMDELRKVRRVADRTPGQVSEVLLVLDATTGQNAIAQAREFTSAVEVTGIVLTKLDGTAKGGVVLAIHEALGLPIKLVGIGEGVADLVPFDPDEFAAALIGD